jgi:hypothetical protein
MKKFCLLPIFLLCIMNGIGQPNWLWSDKAGFSNFNSGYNLDFDQNKNTYLIGIINNPARIGSLVLNCYGQHDILLAKYSQSGSLVWAKTLGGFNLERGRAIKTTTDGHIYITGFYQGTLYYDGQSITANQDAYFLAKLDTNGNYIWIKSGENGSTPFSYGAELEIEVDSLNNVYLTSTCDSNSHLIDTNLSISNSRSNLFFSKFGPNGTMLWTNVIQGNSKINYFGQTMIRKDNDNNLVFATSIGRTDTIINGPSSQTLYDNLMIGKISNNGTVIWKKEYGDTAAYIWQGQPHALTTDANNNIYVSGVYFKNLILANNIFGFGSFISKLNSNDGSVIYTRTLNSNNGSAAFITGLNYDNNGNIISAASFCGTINFGGVILSPVSAVYDCDLVVASYDTTGMLNWAVRYGNPGYESIQGSTIRNSRYGITGAFKDSITFGNFTLIADTFNQNSDRIYTSVCNSNFATDVISIPSSNLEFRIYPNPANSSITLDLPDSFKDYTIQISSINSQIIKRIEHSNAKNIDVSDFPNGQYFLIIKNETAIIAKRFLKN